jgi:putative ABC transport system permease protein
VSPLRPAILRVRLSALWDLYRWRVSQHKVQELLAGGGIAIGVALFFGVLVANASLTGSAGQFLHGIIGSARLQLVARSSAGFDQQLAVQVSQLPGVQIAAPVLRTDATIVGPRGRRPIQLIGLAPAQIGLKAAATRNLGAGALLLSGGVGLPSGVASEIGAQSSQSVKLLVNGDAHPVRVRAILGSQAIGSLAGSPIAVALLGTAQQIAEKSGRVTQVLVEPLPGADRLVAGELRQLAAGRLDVEPATHELSLLMATAKPTSQSTTLFASISAMVGFLLALNAMLLTVPERRRFVAELRTQGFAPRQVLLILASQAAMLGLASSLVGVLLGDVLSHTLFHQVPSYLTLAFPIGSQPMIPVRTVLLALGCGMLATLLASAQPVLDLHPSRSVDAVLHETGEAGQSIDARTVGVLGLIGISLTLAVILLVLVAPSLTIVGGVVLALAACCLIPCAFVVLVRCLRPLSERIRGSMLALAVVELDATATRSIALASVAALAIYGSVAIQGARHDLIRGLDSAVVEYLDTADVWVSTSNNFLTVDSFHADGAPAAIARAPGIASVRTYQGGLLDIGTRRLWIRARPPADRTLIQASQLLHGDLVHATALLRQGGWAVISNGFADERALKVGNTFTLPTPSGPARFGVAAITTNVGWSPGAITLNANDYSRYWHSSDPTALEINLKPGVSPAAGKRAVERALGPRPGLLTQTYQERKTRYQESARQGVRSLSEISTLLLIAAALAIAFALSAAIWERRARLASLKSHGFNRDQLWRSLLLESTIVLSIGSLDGAILGVYGHALASRWLKLSTGFPAPFSLDGSQVLITLASVICIALAVIALPGFAAAQVSPRASFQE